MKTLKVLLQEVVSGIKAWVNSNFAQESNTVHKTGDETVNGVKTFTGTVFHQNSRSIYHNTNISRETTPEANTAVDTFSHLGAGWVYWGGLKHIWKTDGTSIIELATANHRQVNGTWTQGFWSLQLSALKDFSNIEFIPSDNATINLGSNSKRWKNVYSFSVLGNVFETLPGTTGLVLRSTDQTWENGSRIFLYSNTHTGQTYGSIYIDVDHGDGNNTKSALILLPGVFYPVDGGTNGIKLGDSTHKWKSFNGVNPGALSFPDYSDTTYIDISGSIVPPTGETEINKNLGNNYYTPPVDGWLSIRCDGAQYLQIYRNTYNCPGVTAGDGTASIKLVVTLPVRKNETYTIRIKKEGAGIENYQLYPCLGNV